STCGSACRWMRTKGCGSGEASNSVSRAGAIGCPWVRAGGGRALTDTKKTAVPAVCDDEKPGDRLFGGPPGSGHRVHVLSVYIVKIQGKTSQRGASIASCAREDTA